MYTDMVRHFEVRQRNGEFESNRRVKRPNVPEASGQIEPTRNTQESKWLALKHYLLRGPLGYVFDSNNPPHKRYLLGLCIAVVSIGFSYYFGILIGSECSKFLYDSILISMGAGTAFVTQISFPAINICNLNLVKKHEAELILQGSNREHQFFLESMRTNDKNMHIPENIRNNVSSWKEYYDFRMKVAPSCAEMIYLCIWNGEVVSCEEFFQPILTDHGVCCEFNMAHQVLKFPFNQAEGTLNPINSTYINWSPEYQYKNSDPLSAIPRRGHGSGVDHGFTFALDPKLHDYYLKSSVSVGFKMLLHNPGDFPQVGKYGYLIATGIEHQMEIYPDINEAKENVRDKDPKIRQCYYGNEKFLLYFGIYTKNNCHIECRANYTLKFCGCIPKDLPMTSNAILCHESGHECAVRVKNLMENTFADKEDFKKNFNYDKVPNCACYDNCHRTEYKVMAISQGILSTQFKVKEALSRNNLSYFAKNIGVVNLLYADDIYPTNIRIVYFTFADLVASIGGIIGLFISFSLLALFNTVLDVFSV